MTTADERREALRSSLRGYGLSEQNVYEIAEDIDMVLFPAWSAAERKATADRIADRLQIYVPVESDRGLTTWYVAARIARDEGGAP